jgi:hypothetical protein
MTQKDAKNMDKWLASIQYKLDDLAPGPFYQEGRRQILEEITRKRRELNPVPEVTVNEDQKLYVISTPEGTSCFGFENAARETAALALWMQRKELLPKASSYGTLQGYESYQEILKITRTFMLDNGIRRCPVALTPELLGKEGARVEVPLAGQTPNCKRFLVGMSTGWMPCHLELSRDNSTGGHAVSGPFTKVDVIRQSTRSKLAARDFGVDSIETLRGRLTNILDEAKFIAGDHQRQAALKKSRRASEYRDEEQEEL